MSRFFFASMLCVPVLLLACSSETESTPALLHPPDAPIAGPTTSTATRTFAIRSINFGDRGASGSKNLGYDLDGVATSSKSETTCAATYFTRDGNGGIDNAFGVTGVGMLQGLFEKDLSDEHDARVARGRFAQVVEVRGLDGNPAQSNTALEGGAIVAGALGHAPAWSLDDHWPARTDGLSDAATLGSGLRARAPDAYVTHGTAVLRFPLFPLAIAMNERVLVLRLHDAVVVFDPSSPTTRGTIAGKLVPNELVSDVTRQLFDCQPDYAKAFRVSFELLRDASDVRLDGARDPALPCDALSFGAAFEAVEVGALTSVVPSPAPAAQCAYESDAPRDAKRD